MEMLTGKGNPSKYLKAEVGAHYKNTDTGDIFECVSANKHSRINLHQTGGYIWKKVASGDHMEVCAGGGGGQGAGGSDGSGGAFVVNFVITYDEDTGYSTATTDKTVAEIKSAFDSGKVVIGFIAEEADMGRLVRVHDNAASFQFMYLTGEVIAVMQIDIFANGHIQIVNAAASDMTNQPR